MRSTRTTRSQRTILWMAAILVLAAFSVHAAADLSHHHSPQDEHDCVQCYLQHHVAVESGTPEPLGSLAPASRLAPPLLQPADAPAATPPTSRGPPSVS